MAINQSQYRQNSQCHRFVAECAALNAHYRKEQSVIVASRHWILDKSVLSEELYVRTFRLWLIIDHKSPMTSRSSATSSRNFALLVVARGIGSKPTSRYCQA